MAEFNNFEQNIYNTHLRVTRSLRDKPFKLRKNFDKIDDEVFINIKKLSNFFNRFDHINIEDFFSAPYKIYSDNEYYDLKYYTTQKARVVYSLYIKQLTESLNPDDPKMLKQLVESLKFIHGYCVENSIDVDKYLTHVEYCALFPAFIDHLKKHKILLYTLYGLDSFDIRFRYLEKDLIDFMFGDKFLQTVDTLYKKFLSSKTCKVLVREGLKKIQNSIKGKQIK